MSITMPFENILACARTSGRFAARNDKKHQKDYWNRTISLYESFGGPTDALLMIAEAYRQGASSQQNDMPHGRPDEIHLLSSYMKAALFN